MGQPVTAITNTMLSVDEIKRRFAATTQSMVSKIGTLRGNTLEYFEPNSGPAALRPSDEIRPALEIGVTIPTTSGWHGGDVTLQLFVYDYTEYREVRIYAPFSMGGKGAAKKALGKLWNGLALA